jgi:hypothetical protein
MFKKILGMTLAVGAFALGSPVAAAAPDATGCMPPIVGVPWSGAAPTVSALDDLVWNGSFAYEWAMGGPHDGEFRNLLSTDAAGNKTLYVYYKSLVHRPTIYWGDGVQFGISYDDTSTGSKQTIGQIVNFTFGATAGDGPNLDGTWTAAPVDASGNPVSQAPLGVKLVQQTTTYDASGNPVLHPTTELPTPAWVGANAYFWILKDPAPVTSGPPNLYYVVQVKIPVRTVTTTTTGLFVDPAQFATPSLGIPFWGDELSYEVTSGIQIPRPWPNIAYGSQGRLDGDKYQPPSPDHWGKLQPADHSSCTGGGLTFGPSDIVNNGGYTIDLYSDDASGTAQRGSNTMAVNVHNQGPAITNSTVSATFNIAPFGSQTARSVSWQPINIDNNAFKCASGTVGDFSKCKPQPVASTPIPSTAMSTGANFTLQASTPWSPAWSYTCAVFGDDGVRYLDHPDLKTRCMSDGQWLPSLADVDPATHPDGVEAVQEHQCMMVQLNSTTSVQFDTQSQFANMHVAAHASHFEQRAHIDTSGAPNFKGQSGHWIYLVIETRNMLRDIPNGIDSPYSDKLLQRLFDGDCDGEVCNRRTPAFDYVAKYFPTAIVHVYHPTGLSKKIKGKKVDIYEPQSSYGYYVSHDGKLFGWDVALKGAKKVAANTYRVWVANDKAVDVTTTVDALEKPRSTCGGGGDDDNGKD